MPKIRDNRLLLGSLIAVTLYWVVGILTPNPYVSSVSSLMLLIAGAMTLYRYVPVTYDIVARGQRAEGVDETGHRAVYGTTLLAAGSFYVGLFGLLWVYFGQPQDWLGTPSSGFGRAMMAAGFWLMYTSPDANRDDIRLPNPFWLAAFIAVAVLAAFFAGTRVQGQDDDFSWRFLQLHGDDRPVCPRSRPIWGSSSHRYHGTDSPYRDLVIPIRCFEDEKEARAAGFSPVKTENN